MLSEGSGAVEATHHETDGEHEASDVVDAASESGPAESVTEEKPAEVATNGEKDAEPAAAADMPIEDAKPAASPPTSPRKIKAKPSINFKPPAGKPAAGPPTPLVKKVRVISGRASMKPACARHAQSMNATHRSSTRARLGLARSRLHPPQRRPLLLPRLPGHRLRPPHSRRASVLARPLQSPPLLPRRKPCPRPRRDRTRALSRPPRRPR